MSALPADLSEVIRHLEACYPEEGCGLVFRGAQEAWRVQPIRNAAGSTARTAYALDPGELLGALLAARASGEELAVIFHSHPDAEAGFSEEDRRQAALDGAPLYPAVCYLVVSVVAGRAAELAAFAWESGDFQPTPVPGGAKERDLVNKPRNFRVLQK